MIRFQGLTSVVCLWRDRTVGQRALEASINSLTINRLIRIGPLFLQHNSEVQRKKIRLDVNDSLTGLKFAFANKRK